MTVVLKQSPEDINNKAVKLFQKYGVGRTTNGAKGVLFLIDPSGKQVRIEIGYDLEPIFTDGFTGYIERRQMTPFFQANKVGPGIEASVELNQWHLRQTNHKYMFGFKAVFFDKNGFPHKK